MKTDTNVMVKDAVSFAQIDEQEFAKLYSELENLPVALATTDAVFKVVRSYNLLKEKDGTTGNFILYTLYQFAQRGQKTKNELFERLIKTAKYELEGSGKDLNVLDTLNDRLNKLGQLENVIISLKASILLTEREKVLQSARVISDVRPVMEDELSNPTMLILNTLKLEYQKNGEKQTTYIALDMQDIENLISQLERAQQKTASLLNIFRASNTRVVE